jgi:hypothetical protein
MTCSVYCETCIESVLNDRLVKKGKLPAMAWFINPLTLASGRTNEKSSRLGGCSTSSRALGFANRQIREANGTSKPLCNKGWKPQLWESH